jgi:hypothetical protein
LKRQVGHRMNPARQGFGIGSVYENSLSTVIAPPVNDSARAVNCKPWSDQCMASSAAVVYSAIAACALGGSLVMAVSSFVFASHCLRSLGVGVSRHDVR